jgi:uncharacterized protein (TIGR03437 family)
MTGIIGVVAALFIAATAFGQPEIRAIVNAASLEPAVSRGSLASIFGTGLASSTVEATSMPLPQRLGGTAVLVGDLELEAPLYYVSPTQINFQLPFEALGDRLPIVVAAAAGRSRPHVLAPPAAAPGVFTRAANGKGPALVFGPTLAPADAVAPGDAIVVYATGLGATDPPLMSGRPGATAEPFNRVVNAPEVFVGDAPAEVTFAGVAPGLAGIYQLNLIARAAGTDRIWMRSRGHTSNIAEIGIRQGRNVTNASGSIELLYPLSPASSAGQPFDSVGQSPHLVVARFNARLDIAPDAGPFSVVAIADGDASSAVTFDPANGTYEALVTVPDMPPRHGDFSRTGLFPIDLFTCHPAPDGVGVCHPFPGAIIPQSRIHPRERELINTFPLPNEPVATGATGIFRVRGQAQRGSTVVIGSDSPLATFAGYVVVPLPPAPNRTATLKLFIDGQRVAFNEVSYRVGPFGF